MKRQLFFPILASIAFFFSYAKEPNRHADKPLPINIQTKTILEAQSANSHSKNLLNENDADFVKGYYLDGKGILQPNTSYAVSGFIPVTEEMGILTSSVAGSLNCHGGGAYAYMTPTGHS